MHPQLRTPSILFALVLAAPAAAFAQDVPEECGQLAHADLVLERKLDLFVSDELAGFRQRSGIQQLSPDVERARVTDDEVCEQVLAEALKVLDEIFGPTPADESDDEDEEDEEVEEEEDEGDEDDAESRLEHIDFAIFRYGAYYVVPIQFKVTEDVIVGGYNPVLVFRADPLEFLNWILG